MFSARISHRAKTATALVGIPAVAAGLWLTTAGAAQAAETPTDFTTATSKAEPIYGEPVLIKAPSTRARTGS